MSRAAALLLAVAAAAFGGPPALAQETAVVSNRVIYPGETIARDALETIKLRRGRSASSSVAIAVEELEGMVARRTILPNRFIPVSSVREPWLVERGTPARVVFQAGALTITTTAVPLESGSAGDVIRVRNLDSGTIFSGIVLADGTIRVGAT